MNHHPPYHLSRRRAGASRTFFLVVLLVAGLAAALFVSNRGRRARWPDPVRTATAVGDSTCISCHRDKASFEGTAHRLTMQHPTRATVAGHFGPGQNVLRTPNPDLYFHMNADSAGFTQTAVLRNGRDSTTRTERFALVSGIRKGQSYLYWAGNRLYQLPGVHRRQHELRARDLAALLRVPFHLDPAGDGSRRLEPLRHHRRDHRHHLRALPRRGEGTCGARALRVPRDEGAGDRQPGAPEPPAPDGRLRPVSRRAGTADRAHLLVRRRPAARALPHARPAAADRHGGRAWQSGGAPDAKPVLSGVADDVHHLSRRAPDAARPEGAVGTVPRLPPGAELQALPEGGPRAQGPLRRLPHAPPGVQPHRLGAGGEGGEGAGAHALDQGLAR